MLARKTLVQPRNVGNTRHVRRHRGLNGGVLTPEGWDPGRTVDPADVPRVLANFGIGTRAQIPEIRRSLSRSPDGASEIRVRTPHCMRATRRPPASAAGFA